MRLQSTRIGRALCAVAVGTALCAGLAFGQGSASSNVAAQPKRRCQREWRHPQSTTGISPRRRACAGGSVRFAHLQELHRRVHRHRHCRLRLRPRRAARHLADRGRPVRCRRSRTSSLPVPQPRRAALRRRDRGAGIRHTGWAQGACVGDVDDDGFEDLYIPHWGQNRLYVNTGKGKFIDQTAERGLTEPSTRWGPAARSWISTATGTSTCSRPTTCASTRLRRPSRARTASAAGRPCGALRPARASRRVHVVVRERWHRLIPRYLRSGRRGHRQAILRLHSADGRL